MFRVRKTYRVANFQYTFSLKIDGRRFTTLQEPTYLCLSTEIYEVLNFLIKFVLYDK